MIYIKDMNDEEYEEIMYEIRYITLELMKLAYFKKKSFKQIAKEYIKNVVTLNKMIESMENEY